MSGDDSDTSVEDAWLPPGNKNKKFKTNSGRVARNVNKPSKSGNKTRISLSSLLEIPLPEKNFEDIIPKDDYLAARHKILSDSSEVDLYNNRIRPLTLSELQDLRVWFKNTAAAGRKIWTAGEAILVRKLELQKLNKLRTSAFSYDTLRQHSPRSPTLRLPSLLPPHSAPNEETLIALYSIHKTPYGSSFASRLLGGYGIGDGNRHLIHRDWVTRTTWMDLMSDIRLFHSFMHPDDERPAEVNAPIDFVSLEPCHLAQIHDLLARIFWPGIDVSDSLNYLPKQCTIVAVYKRLVVGAAFLSSPEETYLTYLVVRPGWENGGIASVMLYHLITANPGRDITLHVSANSPAMLLYNKFGFKAEEFIVGFYEDYLPKESMACKNAFRLRLRR